MCELSDFYDTEIEDYAKKELCMFSSPSELTSKEMLEELELRGEIPKIKKDLNTLRMSFILKELYDFINSGDIDYIDLERFLKQKMRV